MCSFHAELADGLDLQGVSRLVLVRTSGQLDIQGDGIALPKTATKTAATTRQVIITSDIVLFS